MLGAEFFQEGGLETLTVWGIRCTVCGREEMAGPLLPICLDAKASPTAKRLRKSCDPDAGYLCRKGMFEICSRVEQLDRVAYLKLHLEGGAPAPEVDLMRVPELAQAAYEALAPRVEGS
jgi:hypothetical protein